MRVPLSWLREFVEITLPVDEIASLLTMSGTEVGGVAPVGSHWEGVVIGRVIELAKHANADNLQVARVDVGERTLTLVTAATNLSVGDIVPVIQDGGQLAPDRKLTARRFRGILSEGMLCSGDELGVSADAASIYVLEPEAPVGVDARDYLADAVLDIELTPNRADCFSVVGVAREIAALTAARLSFPWLGEVPPRSRWPEGPAPSSVREGSGPIQVIVEDPDLCPRYTAAYLDGIQIRESPRWMQRRLYLSGLRAINNVVDVTNYVMIELGQPLHAFNAELLGGATVRVRRARPGERLTTIDGMERELSRDYLTISDAERPVGLAGVMGGLSSEISEATRQVLLESATFDQRAVRRASQGLRLSSEASKRFDKGLDPELPLVASRRAVSLLCDLADARAASVTIDIRDSSARSARRVDFAVSDIGALIGRDYSVDEVRDVLVALGFEVEDDGSRVSARVPSWRGDVEGRADIAEEVARITGYDAIPVRLLAGAIPAPIPDATLRWEESLKGALAGAGLQEVITYALVDSFAARRLDPSATYPPEEADEDSIPISNPMTPEHNRLRTSLLPSLLNVVARNLRHRDGVAVFEIARAFLPPLQPLPSEPRRLAIGLAGRRQPLGWDCSTALFDFYDLKGAIEAALEPLHLHLALVQSGPPIWSHPTRYSGVSVVGHGGPLGVIGEVHPVVAQRFDLSCPVYLAEVDLEPVLRLARDEVRVTGLPRFPAVVRDLAILVEEGVTYEQLCATIQQAGGPLLEQTSLFDVYRGAQIPSGVVSLAYSLSFRAPDRTLEDREVEAILGEIETALASVGGRVRRK